MFLRSVLSPTEVSPPQDTRPFMDRILRGSFPSRDSGRPLPPKIVLVNWNIERGVRYPEILNALREGLAADVYVLQEVDLHTRRAGYRNVAEELARALGVNYVFGIEFEELAQGRPELPSYHGQAVLSRLPINRPRVLRFRHQLHNWGRRWLPRWSWFQPRRGGRMTLVAEIPVAGQNYVIYNIHLESKVNDLRKALQIREVLEDIEMHYPAETPVIVAGDLNTREGLDSPIVRQLRDRGFRDALEEVWGPHQVTTRSKERKDWIFLRDVNFAGAEIQRWEISDHYPLVVELAAPAVSLGREEQNPCRPMREKLVPAAWPAGGIAESFRGFGESYSCASSYEGKSHPRYTKLGKSET